MVTGGSTADLAIILIDARYGVLPQTRRHTFIATLLGIQHIVVAVNKMDLVDYSEDVFEQIRQDYADFVARLNIHDIDFIPMSALKGHNIVDKGDVMPWYHGPALLDYLETVIVASDRNMIDMRFPVQYVARPDLHFRGYCGTVASGIIRQGEEVMVLPSGMRSRVESIHTFDGEIQEAFPPMAVTVTLADEIDISRGDMLVHVHNVPRIERRLEAMVVWMSETPLALDKPYLIKHTTNMVRGVVSDLRYRVDINTLHREEAKSLQLNEIGRAVLNLHRPLAYDPYAQNRSTGCFIIVDRITNATVGAGMILEREPNEKVVERRAVESVEDRNIHPVTSQISLAQRSARMNQQPATVWLTGLPKSGKSAIAYALEKRLFEMGYLPHVLDGENLRLGVSSDLGFSGDDRSENIRRAAEVARLCNDVGLITIAAFVSPYREGRQHARQAIGAERFVEVFLDTPLEVCEARDNENLYERARSGEIRNFSGISAPYEKPESPDLALPTHEISVDESVDRIIRALADRGVIS
jgi:bifunctional enzyme CysN/CysC